MKSAWAPISKERERDLLLCATTKDFGGGGRGGEGGDIALLLVCRAVLIPSSRSHCSQSTCLIQMRGGLRLCDLCQATSTTMVQGHLVSDPCAGISVSRLDCFQMTFRWPVRFETRMCYLETM